MSTAEEQQEEVEDQRFNELAILAGKSFSPSAPIDERSLFAGRTDQIIQAMDAINQKGQHAIIFGDRGVGKTSLANVLGLFIPVAESTVKSIRVNCDTGDTYDSIWKKVFYEIQPNEDAVIGGFLGQSMRERFDRNEDFVTPEIVRRQLSYASDSVSPLIIIDEFDRIDDRYRPIFADTIKTLSDHAVAATVLLVGVADSVDQLITEHESVQRALVQVRMPRMSPEDVEEVIKKGLDRLGMSIDENAMQRIQFLAQGLPHYAHLLGLHASRTALRSHSTNITIDTLFRALELAIQGAQQSIKSAVHKATVSPKKNNLFSEVLLSCALAKTDEMGTFAAFDVKKPMQSLTGKNYEIPSFAQHLSEFIDEKRGKILTKIGAARRFRYRFSNPLLQPYVIMSGYASGKIPVNTLRELSASDLPLPAG